MTFFSEHRLLNFSRRTARASFDAQNANADTKGVRTGSNPNADLVESLVQTNYQTAGHFGPNVLTPEQQKTNDAGLLLADANNYVAAPGVNPARVGGDPRNPTGAAPPAGAMVGDERNMFPGGAPTQSGPTFYGQWGNAADMAANENYQNSLKEGKLLTNAGKIQARDATRNSMGSTITPIVPSPTDTMMENLKALAASDPNLAAFLPQIEGLVQQQGQAGTGAQDIYDDATSSLDASDVNNDGVTDGVASAVSESKKLLTDDKHQSDAINKENRDIATEAANIAKEMQEIEKAKFELSQIRNENQLREQNIEMELKNRRVAARLGINHETNGLKWMQDSIRKGNEALAFLEQGGDLQSSQFALQIGRQYNLDIKSAINDHASVQAQLNTNYRKELESLDGIVSLDAKERRKEKQELDKWLFSEKSKADTNTATLLKDFTLKMMDHANERAKERAGEILTTGDTLEFVGNLQDQANNNQIFKQAKQVSMDYGAMTAAWDRSRAEAQQLKIDPNSTTRLASDQALITKFNKLLDPTSVVRESEYARTMEGQTALDRLFGFTDQWITSGGSGLTDKARQELYDVATAVQDSYQAKLLEEAQPYLMRATMFNSQANVQRPITDKEMEMILGLSGVPLTDAFYDTLETSYGGAEQSYNASGTENQEKMAGFLDPAGAPPGGYRTDRHNNPTAFITKIAENAGLVLGVDYEIGDPFPDNPNLRTAKLLGDGVQQTIKVIDKIGFQTQGGKQRWTHTSMTKKEWDSLTMQGKRDVIARMYQKEGGTGVLVNGGTMASVPQDQYMSRAEPQPALTSPNQLSVAGINAPQGSGSLPGMGGGGFNPGVITQTPSKRYQNIQTGAVIEVKPGQSDPYAQRPYEFSPIS